MALQAQVQSRPELRKDAADSLAAPSAQGAAPPASAVPPPAPAQPSSEAELDVPLLARRATRMSRLSQHSSVAATATTSVTGSRATGVTAHAGPVPASSGLNGPSTSSAAPTSRALGVNRAHAGVGKVDGSAVKRKVGRPAKAVAAPAEVGPRRGRASPGGRGGLGGLRPKPAL